MLWRSNRITDTLLPSHRSSFQSERERAGLRGPVRSCLEESVYPATKHQGEVTNYVTTEYRQDGKILTWRSQSGGSEWMDSYTYDADGRITKIVSAKGGELPTETLFTYDENGRVVSITDGPPKGCRVDFQYDAEGRKTAWQTFDSETIRRGQNVAGGGSGWHAAVCLGAGVPVGGKIKTAYNEKGQAAESQILGPDGQLITQFSCTYDADGRLLEEKSFAINPARSLLDRMLSDESLSRLTPEQKQRVRDSRQELRTKLEEFMHATFGSGWPSAETSYTYDSHGRTATISERHLMRETIMGEKIITQVRNEQGDVIEWRQDVTLRYGDLVEGRYVIRHSYQYDSYGNWTQQASAHPGRNGGPDKAGSVVTRKIAYY
jgi:YD repeat-containing protein